MIYQKGSEYVLFFIFSNINAFNSSSAWRKMTFAVVDWRFDGKRLGSLLCICFPASGKVLLYDVVYSREDDALKITQRKEVPGISVSYIRATRPCMFDLLVLQPDFSLSLMTYDLLTIPIEPRFSNMAAGERSDVFDVSMAGSNVESDLSMASVVDRMKIVALKDPIESAVTLVFEDGSKSSMGLNLNPIDALVLKMIDIVAVYVEPSAFFQIHKRFLQLWVEEDMSGSPDVQFDCMAEAILGGLWKVDKPTELSGSNAWQSLASSSSHFRLYDDTALLDLNLHSPFPKHPPAPPLSRATKIQLSAIVTAFHVLAEELRLTTHMHLALSKLVVLIARICRAARPGWADYTKRLFPYSAEGWVSGVYIIVLEFPYEVKIDVF